jgi:hypothetical protein
MTEERVYEFTAAGRAERAFAARQALSRIVNERIVQLSDGAGSPGALLAVVCECGNDGCTDRIELTKAEYEAIRANASRFVLRAGHETAAVERVVERGDGYVVTERAGANGAPPRGRQTPGNSQASGPASPSVDELLAELEQARTRNEQLEFALQSRIAIEQAKGVLAERFGWSIDAAFEVLRYAARSARVNIHQLAHQVAAGEPTPQAITAAQARRSGETDARRT